MMAVYHDLADPVNLYDNIEDDVPWRPG